LKKKILLVEDDLELRDTLSDIFDIYGFDCDFAESYDNALECINRYESNYCLIISDFLMPGKNGIDLFLKVKSLESYKTVPYVIFSARTDAETLKLIKKSGVTDFIKKPFEIDRMSELIRKYCKLPR
jgi:DNA-binding NtrC family response regulator